jgi:hypothetical protein
MLTKYQYSLDITILISMESFFDTVIDVDY